MRPIADQEVAAGSDGTFRIVRGVAKNRASHRHRGATPDRDAVEDLLAEPGADPESRPDVVGDSAYADGATLDSLGEEGYEVVAKVPPAHNGTGGFTKDRFGIDLEASTVTCPAAHTVPITFGRRGVSRASFAPHCATCPLRTDCTSAATGRSITIHPHEAALQRAKAAQQTEEWKARYRADRPIVERKIAHFTRRPWGGRKARVRGLQRIKTDVATRAGVLNWARLAVLGLQSTSTGWAVG